MVLKKSQRVVSFLLTLAMLLALSSFFCIESAYAVSESEWTYEQISGGLNITGYIGMDTSVTVPAKLGGQKVVKVSAISTNNFKSKITSVKFSDGITALGDSILKGYTSLERVTLPETLLTIGKDAFAGCIALKAITVPNSVTEIGFNAFGDCTALMSATLSCKATVIPGNLFSGDTKLNTVTLPTYTSEIGDLAFGNCSSITSITLPDTVKTIGNSAFNNCTSLTSISLSSELKTIGELAFYNCSSLKTLFIPNKTKTINADAFSGCTSLKSVYISPSVNVIKPRILNNCSSLETVVFGGENNNFGAFSTTTSDATIYYPEKYSSSWASYPGLYMKAYKAPVSLTISGGKNIKPGDKINLKLTAAPASSEFSDVYTISSSNPTVATVSADGTVIARATGVTTITVTNITGISKSIDITVIPDAPTSVKATAKTTTSAVISWKGAANVTGYNIYRSTTKTGTYKKVGSTTSTTYTDKGLTKGKTYYYKVASYVNSQGKQVLSSYSSVVSIKACAPAPATITAKKVKAGSAKITWGKSTGATGYEVYMATSSSGKYTKIATITKASTLSYTKSGLTSGKTYYFKVRTYTTVDGKKIYSGYTKVVKVKV
ncbi:MAG: leucine-rich repeat protein [Oscillospiraceae bacterium]|nr:leucine-rich repeat protein [Oscillospiraceae bacterium]